MVVLVPEDVLRQPPSREDGIDAATEARLRNFGVQLIQAAGVLLRSPQLTIASGAIMFQRFYFRKSFADLEVRMAATAALFLAGKLQETHRRLDQVLVVFHRLEMRTWTENGELAYRGRPAPMLARDSEEFAEAKQQLIRAEKSMLRELGFEVALLLDHPHRHMLMYAQALGRPRELLQRAWCYLNDSLRTTLCCRHQPEEIALASLFLAARSLGVKLPGRPLWWEALGADSKNMQLIAGTIVASYKTPAEHVFIPRKRRPAKAPEPSPPESTPAATPPAASPPEAPPARSPSEEAPRAEEEDGDARAANEAEQAAPQAPRASPPSDGARSGLDAAPEDGEAGRGRKESDRRRDRDADDARESKRTSGKERRKEKERCSDDSDEPRKSARGRKDKERERERPKKAVRGKDRRRRDSEDSDRSSRSRKKARSRRHLPSVHSDDIP